MPRYRFVEWRDETGAVVGTTPSLTIFIDGDKILTACYEEVPVPEYILSITAMTGGTTSPAPGTYTYPEATTVKVTAIPDPGYVFDHWTLDGIDYTTNPITIVMDSDHSLTAYFSEEAPPPPERYKLNISVTIGGTTEPEPGVYEFDVNTAVEVLAIPDEDYEFDHFELDGIYDDLNPKTVIMDKDHSLLAVFKPKPPPPIPLRNIALGTGAAAAATGAIVYVGTK